MSAFDSRRILKDVRRTDTTLTLVTDNGDGGTAEMSCGLGDTFYFGLQLVSVDNSLDSKPLTTISLTCRDETGKFYCYNVETDEASKFLPLLQNPERYPTLDDIYYGDDFITLYYHLASKTNQLTVGVFPDLCRYTMKSYATNWIAADLFDAPYLSFYTTDEAGQVWHSTFTAELEEIKRFYNELGDYFKKFDRPKNTPSA